MPAVLITGANRGIGLEFARQYAAGGWEVIATVRHSSPELEGLGVRVDPLDMNDLDGVAAFGERIDDPIDRLIANAGTDHPKQSDSADDARAWADMLVVNTIAPCLLAKALTGRMRQPGGKMIAISSRMGSIADNHSGGYLPYRTSKAALNMAWRSLAIDLRPLGLITAAFNPGWVQTRMGSPNAPVEPGRSIAAMRELIERLDSADSGGFFEADGTPIPW